MARTTQLAATAAPITPSPSPSSTPPISLPPPPLPPPPVMTTPIASHSLLHHLQLLLPATMSMHILWRNNLHPPLPIEESKSMSSLSLSLKTFFETSYPW